MTRSEEALARRAKKRNLSLDEMKEKEASNFQKKQKFEEERPTIIQNISAPSTSVPQASGRWLCSACNNSNLCKISTIHCNRCQRLRSEVDAQRSQGSQVESGSTKRMNSQDEIGNGMKKKELKKQKDFGKKKKTPSSWLCPPVTQDKIEENMKLRRLYENPETRNQLSPEDSERARILVERSERKKKKKAIRE